LQAERRRAAVAGAEGNCRREIRTGAISGKRESRRIELKIAIRSEIEDLTYAELHGRVCSAGRALQALGVQREQRVLMAMDDTPSWPTVFLGAIRIGAVPVPVSYLDTAANFEHFVHDSGARLIVVEAAALATMQEAVAGLAQAPPLVVVNGSGPGLDSLESLLEANAGDLPPADTHRDDFAFWLFSGGSTGLPKGVVHLQHDIPYTMATFGRNILRITEDDVCFSTTKLYHAYGMGNGMSFPVGVGATSVLMAGKPDPAKVLAHIEKYRPTLFFSVPTLYARLSGAPEATTTDFSFIRMCCSAAEPLAPEVLRRWHEVTRLEICDGIGPTEMLHIYCSNRPGDVHPGTSGRPVPGYELKLLDDDEQPVAHGEAGNLFVKGDSALAFYWHQHEKTKRSLQGDWYFTGDRYRETDDGVFVYEGRADDMIKIGGLWASPISIENALIEHPGVLEVAAIGIESDYTTRVKAFVVPCDRQGSAEFARELQAWCKERLRRYEYPQFIEFLEELPKTPTGKIQRYKLRSLANVTRGFA
jgi:benzoate-CoA ligase